MRACVCVHVCVRACVCACMCVFGGEGVVVVVLVCCCFSTLSCDLKIKKHCTIDDFEEVKKSLIQS